MAKLFLSYSRKDSARAQRFCDWLEREGHDVWRDEDDIGGGASFSAEIEKALTDCDAVLVLWSASSVQSAWVRDEAGFGRDKGKLIPLTLDRTEPPLGFRQFQSIDISAWKGRGEPPRSEQIRNAITRIAGLPHAPPSSVPVGSRRRPWRPWAAAVLAVALAAVLAVFLWQRWSSDREIAIAVLPSPQSSDRAMAADYANAAAADMAAFLPRRFDRATVIAPADASRGTSGYRVLISTDPHGGAVNASLTLSDQDGRTTLWSKNWSVADASAADLKAGISTLASKAAFCLMQARGGDTRLSQPALGLYLNGCASAGDETLSDIDLESIFGRVTKLAPNFGPGWDYLALARSWTAEGLRGSSSPAYAAANRIARQTVAVARKLNPTSAMSYDAEYHLISDDTFRGLQVLEQGAKVDPDDGRIQMHLSNQLISVGRMSDAVQAGQRGIELEPSSPFTRSQYIQALIYSGRFSRAKADIAEARKRWPNDPAIDFAENGFQLRYGDPRAALQLIPRISDQSDAATAPYRQLIEARLDPTPAKIDSAIAAFTASAPNDPRGRNPILIALAGFGRVEDAYQLLEDRTFQPHIEIDTLYMPEFAKIRADPRFMQVAARLGLVRYWRQTGYWPDFCASEKLKYDCKTEAAKFAS